MRSVRCRGQTSPRKYTSNPLPAMYGALIKTLTRIACDRRVIRAPSLPGPDETSKSDATTMAAKKKLEAPILPGANKVHSMVWYYTWTAESPA